MKIQKPDIGSVPVFKNGKTTVSTDQGIRSLRNSLGMNAEQFGQRIGVSARTVEGWEQGRQPSSYAMISLAMLYGKKEWT